METNYTRLDMEDRETFTKTMNNMLEVWDNHSIYICHPNQIFKEKVEWDNIDINKMFESGNYETFLTFDFKEAFKYVHNRLGKAIMEEIKEKGRDNAVSYLVVVERYSYEGEDNYLVRGLIRGDIKGYSVLFNPEFIKAIPKTTIEATLRIDGDEEYLPETYKKRR